MGAIIMVIEIISVLRLSCIACALGQFAVLLVIVLATVHYIIYFKLGICLIMIKISGSSLIIEGSTASEYMHRACRPINSLGMRHEVLHCLQCFLEVIFAHSPEYDNARSDY